MTWRSEIPGPAVTGTPTFFEQRRVAVLECHSNSTACGSGAADIGKGTLRGAGSVAKGTGKGAVDLVTLHPVEAAGSVGKGAVGAGKDVTVGTAKGAGKIARGVGKAIKHVL
jgi:hypothetical protein